MSTVDELERLVELRNRGAITDEEFKAAKAKVLDSNTKPQTAPNPPTVGVAIRDASGQPINEDWRDIKPKLTIDDFGFKRIGCFALVGFFAIGVLVLITEASNKSTKLDATNDTFTKVSRRLRAITECFQPPSWLRM